MGLRGPDGRPLDLDGASYFVSELELVVTDRPGMARWRTRVFIGLALLETDPVLTWTLPRNRTVVMGVQIEL